MQTHIHAEVSGTHIATGQTYGSDICWDGIVTPQNGKDWLDWRKFVHDNLDEFLDNYSFADEDQDGQYFYIGNIPKEN